MTVQSPTSAQFPTSVQPAWARAVAVLLAAISLCWAAAINGQPFFHPDSIGYVRGPDVAVMKLVGEKYGTVWAKFDPGSVDQRHSAAPPAARTASYDDNEVLAGRSIYYGVLAYLGALTGGFWLTVFIQGLAVAWLAEILLRALRVTSLAAYAGVMAVLILATPAPFFVGFLMPDIWAGVAIGAVAILFALPGRLKVIDVAVLGAMTLFAALAHNSVPPVIVALMAAGGGWWMLRRTAAPIPGLGLAVGAIALVGALAGNLAFAAMVKHSTGQPPLMPPFLTARVIADGTGTRFVRERCDGAFVVCRYAGRFPMAVDDFLWASGPTDGVFETASSADRRALGSEQTRFAFAVVRAYPLQQAWASLRNVAAQAVAIDLSDFNYKPSVAMSLSTRMPPASARALRRTLAYGEGWPLGWLWALQFLVVQIAAGVAIGAGLHARRMPRRAEEATGAIGLFSLVVVGVLANAAVCGALSTLYGRYEARVIWLLPLAGCALVLASAPITTALRRAWLRFAPT
jgi:hypothetical protein